MISKYMLVWLVLAVVATLNGILRQFTYGKSLSDLVAHQVSTVTAILLTGLVVWQFNRIWPIESAAQAITIGVLWLLATMAFEFGFGHYVAGHSWDHLLADHKLFEGRIWSLFLVWMAVLPFVIYRCFPRES